MKENYSKLRSVPKYTKMYENVPVRWTTVHKTVHKCTVYKSHSDCFAHLTLSNMRFQNKKNGSNVITADFQSFKSQNLRVRFIADQK